MASTKRGAGGMPTPSPSHDDRLRSLRERADALQSGAARPPAAGGAEAAATSQAYRLIAELLGGVLVGLALGFGVDRLTGHPPVGLIGGVLLGFAVSVWMAKQTADRLTAQAKMENGGAPAASVSADDEDDD